MPALIRESGGEQHRELGSQSASLGGADLFRTAFQLADARPGLAMTVAQHADEEADGRGAHQRDVAEKDLARRACPPGEEHDDHRLSRVEQQCRRHDAGAPQSAGHQGDGDDEQGILPPRADHEDRGEGDDAHEGSEAGPEGGEQGRYRDEDPDDRQRPRPLWGIWRLSYHLHQIDDQQRREDPAHDAHRRRRGRGVLALRLAAPCVPALHLLFLAHGACPCVGSL